MPMRSRAACASAGTLRGDIGGWAPGISAGVRGGGTGAEAGEGGCWPAEAVAFSQHNPPVPFSSSRCRLLSFPLSSLLSLSLPLSPRLPSRRFPLRSPSLLLPRALSAERELELEREQECERQRALSRERERERPRPLLLRSWPRCRWRLGRRERERERDREHLRAPSRERERPRWCPRCGRGDRERDLVRRRLGPWFGSCSAPSSATLAFVLAVVPVSGAYGDGRDHG